MDILTLALLASQTLAPTPAVAEDARAGFPTPVPPITSAGPMLGSRFALASPRQRPQRDTFVEYSAAYYRRLDIHRFGSYTMLPLFAFQLIAGAQLYDKSFEAPGWAKTGHRVAATGVAALFTVNTVTGLMNLYAGRHDPKERRRKVFHALMMLTADAGFTATGILAERAEQSTDDRSLHRTVAYASIGIATIGYLSMLDVFRQD